MKAFLSYSINDSEEYIVSYLAQYLHVKGTSLDMSYTRYDTARLEIKNRIKRADFFIGILTPAGGDRDLVLNEYQIARSLDKPRLLLVDNNLRSIFPNRSYTNIIFYDRNNINIARKEIQMKLDKLSSNIRAGEAKAAAWVLGGLAAIALIGALSSKDK